MALYEDNTWLYGLFILLPMIPQIYPSKSQSMIWQVLIWKIQVEGLLRALGILNHDVLRMSEETCAYMKSDASARIRIADQEIGWMGEIHPDALDPYDIKQAVFIAELNLDALLPFIPQVKKSESISRFPAATRDFTLIVDKTVRAGDILKCVTASGEKWVETVHLFDVFEKDPIPPGKKSISPISAIPRWTCMSTPGRKTIIG